MASGCAFLARQSSRIEYSGARIELTSLAIGSSVSVTFRWAAFVSTSSLNGGSNEEAIDIDAASRSEYHSDDRRLDYQRGAGADGPGPKSEKTFGIGLPRNHASQLFSDKDYPVFPLKPARKPIRTSTARA